MLSILSLSSSAIDSILSMRPMFDLKPLHDGNFKSISNVTQSLYTHIFGFENLFESHKYVDNLGKWMQDYWQMSILISVIYVLGIFGGRHLMESRPKYELRIPLIVWNLFLAVFSILGAIRVWPEFFHGLTQHGVVYTVCDNSYAYSITGFWAFMFIMSKLPELVDTLFIVLRKQKLIFLHWYHHSTVLIYCWFSYKDFSASGRWFMTMNYFVHGLMYSYYACKAMKLKVPKFVSQLITTSQLLQMVAGVYVNWVAYQTKTHRPDLKCSISDDNIKWSSLMYASYFVLFFHFFLDSYIFSAAAKPKQTEKHTSLAATKVNGQTDLNNNKKSDLRHNKVSSILDSNNHHHNGKSEIGDIRIIKKRN